MWPEAPQCLHWTGSRQSSMWWLEAKQRRQAKGRMRNLEGEGGLRRPGRGRVWRASLKELAAVMVALGLMIALVKLAMA